MRPATTPGQSFLTIRGKYAESRVLKASPQVTAHDLLIFLTLIGINPDAYKLTCGGDDFWITEQTVPRCRVTGSENARHSAAL